MIARRDSALSLVEGHIAQSIHSVQSVSGCLNDGINTVDFTKFHIAYSPGDLVIRLTFFGKVFNPDIWV